MEGVVELRQYRLHPGRREALIDLFDREFVESQEAAGMRIIGQFRDLDDPDRFVWLRGFADMTARKRALEAFYGGPVWRAHRDAANATMIDSDDVLLLRPAEPGSGFALDGAVRARPGAQERGGGIMVATLYHLDAAAEAGFADFFAQRLRPPALAAGAEVAARFVAEHSPNSFPALPVREGERVFAWFARFRDAAHHQAFDAAFAGALGGAASAALVRRLARPSETRRLSPTVRSLLRA